MPLEKAAPGTPGFGRNISEMVKSGHPQKQAIAAAYQAAKGDSTMPNLSALLAQADALFQRADAAAGDSEDCAAMDAGSSPAERFKKYGFYTDCPVKRAGKTGKVMAEGSDGLLVKTSSGEVERWPKSGTSFADSEAAMDESEKEKSEGKLTQTERGEIKPSEREDMPRSAFLKPSERKYPVKAKGADGVWEYKAEMLEAAAKRARLEGADDLAREAESLKAREFGEAKGDAAGEKIVGHDWEDISRVQQKHQLI